MQNALTLMLVLSAFLPAAEPFVPPSGMQMVDLGRPPYALDPSGTVDAGEALQRAIDDHADGGWTLWLPAGTYTVSRQLRWKGAGVTGPQLWGQARDTTIIRLVDRAPGFGDPAKRQGVLWTGNGSADNFWKSVRALTIDVGAGNPGACGIQYMANNMGTVRDVLITAGPGSGAVGLDVAYTDMIGPAYIRDLEIRGFDIGVHAAYTVNGLTFEHLVLSDIRSCGIRNDGQCLSIRDLRYRGTGPALRSQTGPAFTVLIEADLVGEGEAAKSPAIINGGSQALLARDVKATGFACMLESGSDRIVDSPLIEYASQPVSRLTPGPLRSLRLPILEAPSIPWGDFAGWADVTAFGADPCDKRDDTDAIQKAIDSGATTVYFPHVPGVGAQGKHCYRIDGTVYLRGKVQRLIGGGGHWNTLNLTGTSAEPAFIVSAGESPVVVIENLNTWDLNGAGRCFIRHDAPRTLVLRHANALMKGGPLYQGQPGAGRLFIEDVSAQFPMGNKWDMATSAPLITIAAGQEVWARQLNLEKPGTKVVNHGTLWILGLKTEAIGPLIETCDGGRTEVLGGLSYTSKGNPADASMFVLRAGGQGSFSIGEVGYNDRFELVVAEERDGATLLRRRLELPGRCFGSQLTLHAAWRGAEDAQVPPAPAHLAAELLGSDAVRLSWTGSPAAGLYRVLRDGELQTETGNTCYTAGGLPDGTRFTWQVVALSLALAEGGRASVTAATPVDTEAPSLLRANAYPDPARIRVTFSKPMATATRDPASWTLEAGRVVAAEAAEGGSVVVLKTDGFDPSKPGTLRWVDLVDRATKPNLLPGGQSAIGVGRPIRVRLAKDFDGANPLAGVNDNSAWRQGKVLIQTIETGGGNRMLELKGKAFAQVELGRVAIDKGGSYEVQARIRNLGAARSITMQLRQMDPPWTGYGSQVLELASNQELAVRFVFSSAHSDRAAVLFLIADGDSALFLDDLRIVDAEE